MTRVLDEQLSLARQLISHLADLQRFRSVAVGSRTVLVQFKGVSQHEREVHVVLYAHSTINFATVFSSLWTRGPCTQTCVPGCR